MICPPGKSMSFHKKETEKNELVVRPEIVQTMLDMEFGDAVSCLVRVVWAAAAGNLRLASSSSLGSAHSDQQTSRFLASRRSRDSSTGSSHRYTKSSI